MARQYQTGKDEATLRREAYARRVAEGCDGATNRYHNDPEYKARRLAQNLAAQRRRNFGLTLAQFEEMQIAQNGQCAICQKPPKGRDLDVDHDHNTGAIRGLLCRNCNLMLGKINDRVEVLEKAIQYLRKHE